MRPNKTNTLILKLVFGLALLFFVGWKIYSTQALRGFFNLQLIENTLGSFGLFLVLIPVNWGLETYKWKLLLNQTNQLPFFILFKRVLAGIATGIMTPNRIGNFVGRAYNSEIQDKENAVVATFLANIGQFIATVFFGLLALIFLPSVANLTIYKPSIVVLAIVFQALALAVYFKPNNAFIRFLTQRLNHRFQKNIKDIEAYPTRLKWKAFSVAVIRYVIILLQFYAVLGCFYENIEPFLLVGIALTYFLTTLIPSLAFGKLFVREASALFVLGVFNVPAEIILITTFLIWLFNLALPALIGTRLIFKK